MSLISNNLITKISKVEILPKHFSDHNPVSIVYNIKSSSFRWKPNDILQKEVIVEMFQFNVVKVTDLRLVWVQVKLLLEVILYNLIVNSKRRSKRKHKVFWMT